MRYPINMGKWVTNLIKFGTAGWLTQVLRTFSKIAVGGGYGIFVMELTVSKG